MGRNFLKSERPYPVVPRNERRAIPGRRIFRLPKYSEALALAFFNCRTALGPCGFFSDSWWGRLNLRASVALSHRYPDQAADGNQSNQPEGCNRDP